jgi:hypothetical protein
MKKLLLLFFFPLVVGFNGCSTTTPVVDQATAERGVFEAKAAYEVALTAAVAYKKLPACGASQPPCSTPAIVAQLQHAQPAARAALDAAQAAVTSKDFGSNIVSTAVASANAAVSAFAAITSTLPK